MRILFLPNWKVLNATQIPVGKQSPDYYIYGEAYWFFRHFSNASVDVIDISSNKTIEKIEKKVLRFYIIQAFKAFFRMSEYDVVVSHGAQSGIVLSLLRRLFNKKKIPHVVFDIGSFNSAAESGLSLHFMQFASKAFDGLIYHTSMQKDYYQKYYPWLLAKSCFIPFGTDSVFFSSKSKNTNPTGAPYILSIGYAKRDWETLITAFRELNSSVMLRIIGDSSLPYANNTIQVLPVVPVTELIEQISGALFCVLPLEYFNYSYGQMTLLQQMSLGKAVIAARVPSMIDYLNDGETGLFYSPGDAADLKKKMEILIQGKETRETMGRRAANSVFRMFNENRMAGQIENFLEMCIDSK